MKNLFISIVLLVAMSCLLSSLCQAQDTGVDNVINIKAEDYSFQAPEDIPSGWTTIEYTNEGEEPHFLVFARLPEDKIFDDYVGEVVPAFDDVWRDIRDEGIDQEEAIQRLGEIVPEWAWGLEFMGGTGIIEPGETAEVTLYLEPGNYSMECYMKTEEGETHIMEGMVRGFTVNDTQSDGVPPEADIEIMLANSEIAVDGKLSPGMHTVAVNVTEEPPEGAFGHNLHVARMEPNANADEVRRWVDWYKAEGLRLPSPVPFVGGMNFLPVGATGYFTLDLEPGRYLFINEGTAPLEVMQEVVVE